MKNFANNKYFNNLLATNEVRLLPPEKLLSSHVAIIPVMFASIKFKFSSVVNNQFMIGDMFFWFYIFSTTVNAFKTQLKVI